MQDMKNCACAGKSLPKLVRPAVLSVLAKGDSHGYAIVEYLKRQALCGGRSPDHTGVYRALQTMETEGLIASDWERPSSGPARHNYRLTAKGIACLRSWKSTLKHYKRTIDSLLQSL